MATNFDSKLLDYYIFHLREKYHEASRNKAILSFRYDSLEMKANATQVTIIMLSTTVTFLESLKAYYDLDMKIINIASIVLTTLIALIMAIYRFFEIDKKKENVGNSLKDHTFIINKFRKVVNVFNNMKLNPGHFDGSEFNELCKTYDNEVYDNYISIYENFDSIFSFKELIHYRRKYRKYYLKDEIIKREIELIKKNKDKITTRGYVKRNGACKRWLCCKPWCIDYFGFIYDIENDDNFISSLDRRLSEAVVLKAKNDSPGVHDFVKKNKNKRRLESIDSVSHTIVEMEPKIASTKNIMEQPTTLIDSSVFPAIEEQPSNDIKMTIEDVDGQNESTVDIEPQDANREVSISQSKV